MWGRPKTGGNILNMISPALSKGDNFSVQANALLQHGKTRSETVNESRRFIQFICIILIKLWIYLPEDVLIVVG